MSESKGFGPLFCLFLLQTLNVRGPVRQDSSNKFISIMVYDIVSGFNHQKMMLFLPLPLTECPKMILSDF